VDKVLSIFEYFYWEKAIFKYFIGEKSWPTVFLQSNLDIVRLKGPKKNSHKIEVNLEGFLVEGTKNFSHYIDTRLYWKTPTFDRFLIKKAMFDQFL
jgi:hypothetical protein